MSQTTDSEKMFLLDDHKMSSDKEEKENIKRGGKRKAPIWTQFEVLIWRNQC
jgi:hypothetical protein